MLQLDAEFASEFSLTLVQELLSLTHWGQDGLLVTGDVSLQGLQSDSTSGHKVDIFTNY